MEKFGFSNQLTNLYRQSYFPQNTTQTLLQNNPDNQTQTLIQDQPQHQSPVKSNKSNVIINKTKPPRTAEEKRAQTENARIAKAKKRDEKLNQPPELGNLAAQSGGILDMDINPTLNLEDVYKDRDEYDNFNNTPILSPTPPETNNLFNPMYNPIIRPEVLQSPPEKSSKKRSKSSKKA